MRCGGLAGLGKSYIMFKGFLVACKGIGSLAENCVAWEGILIDFKGVWVDCKGLKDWMAYEETESIFKEFGWLIKGLNGFRRIG